MTSDKDWLRIIGIWDDLEDIVASLELAPQHEQGIHTQPIRKDIYLYPHEMALIGREAGPPKAIETVNDIPKTLESTKEKGRKEQSYEGCQYKSTDNYQTPLEAREARDNREEEFKKILKRTIENNKDLLIELAKL